MTIGNTAATIKKQVQVPSLSDQGALYGIVELARQCGTCRLDSGFHIAYPDPLDSLMLPLKRAIEHAAG